MALDRRRPELPAFPAVVTSTNLWTCFQAELDAVIAK